MKSSLKSVRSLSILPEEVDGNIKKCTSGDGVGTTAGGKGVSIANFNGRAALITLGCAKNQVDSEVMLGVLEETGFEIVQDMGSADIIVVNTCGFLESAVKESLDAIFEASEFKKNGRLRKLFVAGCMVERYRDEITRLLPEVDGFLGIDDILRVGELSVGEFSKSSLAEFASKAGRPYFLYDDTMPRRMSTPSHTAYVKISEGCNRPCTFCIIPRIRGAMRSRAPLSIIREVQALVSQGVREINLVGQDLTAYGDDFDDRYSLVDLLHELDKIEGLVWIRLLYAYPLGITSELLSAITSLSKVCKYLDIPLQHASEQVLKKMRRPLGKFAPRSLVAKIQQEAPSIALRTTFIVGFPGETQEDVADLEDFILEGHFTSVGIFTYSPEQGTPSFEYDNHIEEGEKEARRDRLMKAQAKVLKRKLKQMVGTTIPLLLEGYHDETDLLLQGRASFQAPEVDGVIIVNDVDSSVEIQVGSFYDVKISDITGYDLVGSLVGGDEAGVVNL
jgi:ribosomal protein S12 methylthiotransferase